MDLRLVRTLALQTEARRVMGGERPREQLAERAWACGRVGFENRR